MNEELSAEERQALDALPREVDPPPELEDRTVQALKDRGKLHRRRMERSLHPDLAKRAVRQHPESGRPILHHLSKSTLVEYTNSGGGKDTPKEKLFYELTVLDVYKDIATVKAVSADYVDYIHLAKWNGQWMIVNILWDSR